MKNRLLYTLLIFSFLLLTAVFLLFINAYRQVVHYKTDVTNYHLIINEFEKLGSNLKSTQIMTNDFRGYNSREVQMGLQTRISLIGQNLHQLRQMSTDSVNSKRIERITVLAANQFNAFLQHAENAFDSNENAVNPQNFAYQIHAAIDSSIRRANHRLNSSGGKLDDRIGQLKFLIITFGLIAFLILTYASIALLKQVQKIKQAKGFQQSVLNSTQNGIIACKAIRNKKRIADYKIDFVNEGFEKIVGLKEYEVIGKKLSDIYKRLTNQPLKDALQQVKNQPYQFTKEVTIGTEKKWLQFSASAIEDQSTITINDVSELKNAERELKRKVEELQYTNEQLEQFAYIASHDLQEPLRKIATFSELVSKAINDEDEKTSDYIKKIVASSGRLSKLVTDLLHFSLLKKEVQFQRTSLSEIVQNVVDDYELLIKEKKAIIEIVTELPVIEAAAFQMNQLFSNLIGNALKFSKPGIPPIITIASVFTGKREEADTGLPVDHHHITISDNGIGFKEAYAKQIFEIFKRLHDIQTYSGSGIGLAICKKIVSNHNGSIYAESVEGVGTTFHILLPAYK